MGGALRGLVLLVQFRIREKRVMEECYSKAYNFTKSKTPPWVFLNCTYGTKSRKALHSWRSVQDRCNPMRYVHTLNKVVLLVEILI